MKILALDLGTRTGIAIGDARSKPEAMSELLGEAGDSQAARFSRMLQLMTLLIKRHKPDLVAIEAPIAAGPKGGASRAQLAMGLRGCVMGICRMRFVPVEEYPIQTIRKHFIGHGNLQRDVAKSRTVQRCRDLGWRVTGEDEADAMAVWEWARYGKTSISTPPAGGLFDGVWDSNAGNADSQSGAGRRERTL